MSEYGQTYIERLEQLANAKRPATVRLEKSLLHSLSGVNRVSDIATKDEGIVEMPVGKPSVPQLVSAENRGGGSRDIEIAAPRLRPPGGNFCAGLKTPTPLVAAHGRRLKPLGSDGPARANCGVSPAADPGPCPSGRGRRALAPRALRRRGSMPDYESVITD